MQRLAVFRGRREQKVCPYLRLLNFNPFGVTVAIRRCKAFRMAVIAT
jgi:hypothetical protein